MEVNQTIKPNLQIRAMYLFFIITGVQIGVGIIGAPRFIFMEAERDSWLAILISYGFTCLVVYTIFLILNQYKNADFFGIHVDVFGNWIGKFLGTVFILYIGASFFSILLTYIQIVQIFLYHSLPSFVLAALIIILVVYAVLGGVKIVVGVSFLFFLLTFWLLFVLYDPITRMNWYNLLPMFQTSLPDLLRGAKATTYTISGFEILFVIYPFIQNKDKARLPTFLGITFTTLTLLIVMIVSIGYFSFIGLKHVDWALLILYKSASFTFLERMDYVIIVVWLLVIIPNLVLLSWAMTYGMKRLYKVSQRKTLYTVAILTLILVNLFQYDYQITKVTDLVAQVGFWIVFVYPFILLPLVVIKKKWKKRKGSDTS